MKALVTTTTINFADGTSLSQIEMNANAQAILNHLRDYHHVNQIVDRRDTQFWNELDADIHLDVAEGILDAELIGDDIDRAFDELAA